MTGPEGAIIKMTIDDDSYEFGEPAPDIPVPPEVADELRARAFGLIQAYLRGDVEAGEVLVSDDQDAAVLLPVLLGILIDTVALLLGNGDQLAGRDRLAKQVDQWLDERYQGLAGA
jgi:hypothetical protein